MLVKPDPGSERGGVLALSAIAIFVFLMFAALVIDVGNWYTHKRQLQNRADAGALAAGVEYGRQIYRCLSGTPGDVTIAEAEINQAARAFAGSASYAPAPGGGPDTLPDPTVSNTEIANQLNLDVQLNSTSYDSAVSDGGGPCFGHTSDLDSTDGTPVSTDGQWLDVKVKEKDLPSFFSSLGLPLFRNIARARVEIHPAKEVSGFVPLGVPDNRIAKAQARFVNECNGSTFGTPLILKPLASQTVPGLTLWGPDDGLGNATTTPTPVSFTMPAGATGCPADSWYVPISVQVRAAGRSDIDLNTPAGCGSFAALPQRDCWDDATHIRAWATEGDASGPLSGDTVLVEDVNFTSAGGPTGCNFDSYYARIPDSTTTCLMNASVYLDFDKRYALGGTFEAELNVGGSGYTLTGSSTNQGPWLASDVPVRLGLNEATVSWSWKYKGPGTFEGDDCSMGSGCKQDGTIAIHKLRGTDTGSAFDVLSAVKVTSAPVGPGAPEQHSVKLTDATTGGQQNFFGHLGVGLKSSYNFGDFAVLRLRGPQGNYSLVCDPRFPSPSTTDMEAAFYFGCEPPYTKNSLVSSATNYWWKDYDADGEPDCPSARPSGWLTGPPFPNSPWQCVHADTGGNGFGTTDGVALVTGNCQSPSINTTTLKASCPGHNYACNNPINVPGPGDTVDLNDPRIIKIYVLPFNAFNNLPPGANADLPVIEFAAFYVTAWKYNTAEDPCGPADNPGGVDNDNDKLAAYAGVGDKPAQVGGYFIQYVDPDGGAVDETASCSLTGLTPCRAVLVR